MQRQIEWQTRKRPRLRVQSVTGVEASRTILPTEDGSISSARLAPVSGVSSAIPTVPMLGTTIPSHRLRHHPPSSRLSADRARVPAQSAISPAVGSPNGSRNDVGGAVAPESNQAYV